MTTSSPQWQVRIYLSENEDQVSARAVLDTGLDEVCAAGAARRDRPYRSTAVVDEEVATGRALVALGRRLLDVATMDQNLLERATEAAAHRPVRRTTKR